MPTGNYYLSTDIRAYTLIENECFIETSDKKTAIVEATMQVKENEYYGTFRDVNGNKYSIRKQENIKKQRIKSFVY